MPVCNIGEGSGALCTRHARKGSICKGIFMSYKVFVLDRHQKPLMPCHPARARKLLKGGRARIHKRFPFTIRLTDRTVEDSELQSVELKIKPGSKNTGLVLVLREGGKVRPLFFGSLKHRGSLIHQKLEARKNLRRGRRSRKLRYRSPRFLNRIKPKGWLAPSLRHRIETTVSWSKRLSRLAPVIGITQEFVKFDTQALQNPEISGTEYQQGTLFGFEVREYLLEKFHRCCVYCGAENVPLNIDHVVPKAKGGTNRVSNLVLSCRTCNQKKGAKSIEEFLQQRPRFLRKVKSQLQTPLKDAAAVNAVRRILFNSLKRFELPVTASSGSRAKFNRSRLNIPKEPWLDALCLGDVAEARDWENRDVLEIKCTGRGSYQRTRTDKYGFPRGCLMRNKKVYGFATGDMVSAEIPKGKNRGRFIGRVSVRKTGSFNIQTQDAVIQGVNRKYCKKIQPADGYGYQWIH